MLKIRNTTWFDVLIAFVIGLLIGLWFYGYAYKNGQIDALNGKISYCLEKQNDGTTKWIFIRR